MRKRPEIMTSAPAQYATRMRYIIEELQRSRERQARTEQLAEEPIVQTMGSAAIGPEPNHSPQPAEPQQAPIDIQVRRAEKEQQLTSAA